MSARDIVTQGFGSWQTNVAYIPTRGFDIGVAASVWTTVTPQVGGWGDATDDSSIWTVVTPQSGGWS